MIQPVLMVLFTSGVQLGLSMNSLKDISLGACCAVNTGVSADGAASCIGAGGAASSVCASAAPQFWQNFSFSLTTLPQ